MPGIFVALQQFIMKQLAEWDNIKVKKSARDKCNVAYTVLVTDATGLVAAAVVTKWCWLSNNQ